MPERLTSVLLSIIAGIAMILLPMCLFIVDKVIAIGVAALLAASIAIILPHRALGAVVVATIYQNLIISFMSPLLSYDDLNFAKAFSFLAMMVIWLVIMTGYFLDRSVHHERVRKMISESVVVLAIVGMFTLMGMVYAGGNAIVYCRNIATPIVLFQIALVTSSRWRLDFGALLIALAIIILPLGYFELIDRDAYLSATNGDVFWKMSLKPLKEAGRLVGSYDGGGSQMNRVTDFFRVVLFNSSLMADFGVYILRLYGPNQHPISYGYLLALLVIVLGASRQWIILVAILPLLIFVSAKGAVIEIMMVAITYLIWRIGGERLAAIGLGCILLAYVSFTIVSGLRTGDYHVIGLMGGLKGFLVNPIGRGIGVGGNIGNELTLAQWSVAQAKGSTDVALESAIGVLLYQMGIMAFAVIGFYAIIARRAWRLYSRTGMPHYLVASAGTFVVLTNGIFQEEALFAPLAMGLMLSFTAVALGSALREPLPPLRAGIRMRGIANAGHSRIALQR